MPFPRPTRRTARNAVLVGLAAALPVLLVWTVMMRMPGASAHGPLPPLTGEQRGDADVLRRRLVLLTTELGERNVDHAPLALARTADWIEGLVRGAGYAVSRQTFEVRQVPCSNLEVELRGASHPDEIVVVGAHYDTALGTPGADDNGSGVITLLALAESLAKARPGRTLRFVFFVNEEPPFFRTHDMGSVRYARRSRERGENVVAMLALETLGHFDGAAGSQRYPFPMDLFYPDVGDFVGFIGNVESRDLVRSSVAAFRGAVPFPSEGAALPHTTPGVAWSDHEPFWREGYPALMVTDTALFRGHHYHTKDDTAEVVDTERLARVLGGLRAVVRTLADAP